MIKAEIVAHSLSPQGDELISILCTFPRIILAEVNTHRMLSKNTSSSRAIPFNKMVESVKTNPFIPIAWQKEHKGMQGTEYIDDDITSNTVEDESALYSIHRDWFDARDYVLEQAERLNKNKLTKQLCNRLLEPFMWTTMLITGSKESWQNFFELRCPSYKLIGLDKENVKSRKEWLEKMQFSSALHPSMYPKTDVEWLQINRGQAEIHMMDLAEKIYDAVNESNSTQILPTMWHVPFRRKINELYPEVENDSENIVKISVSMAARASYTIVGESKVLTKEEHISLHDRLLSQNPPHSSPMEHCCVCVTDEDYNKSFKGEEKGWFRNYKGFKSYRQIIEESK